MTTVRYGRYVLIDRENGNVVWYEKPPKEPGQGRLYDTQSDNWDDIEKELKEARKKIGVD